MARRTSRRRTEGGSRPLDRRFARAVSILFRAVAVCLAMTLSGALHFAVDLWLDGDAAAEHFSGGSGDEDQDCPPGCASCHCVHASALPVPIEALAPSRLLPAFEVAWSPYESGAPPKVAPPSVYRPPRV